jgi:hypothetical protein
MHCGLFGSLGCWENWVKRGLGDWFQEGNIGGGGKDEREDEREGERGKMKEKR